ncbi:hypothetical protein F4859DRAFT_426853 [Xylaria cf. heliscus]|nr:hypothetical protein F4859DRAFT_426853 [Xylaria cf. heliscus]
MAISEHSRESQYRRQAKSSRRESRNSISPLSQHSQSPDSINSMLGLSNPWDNINSPTVPSHQLSLPTERTLDPRSPVSIGSFSPTAFKEESFSPPTFSLCFRNSSAGSLKRKPEECGEGSSNKSGPLPGFQSLAPYHGSHGLSNTNSPLWTPSTTPELSEGDVYLRHPSMFLAQDVITDKLNSLRIERNKEPLPPLEALCSSSGFPSQATHRWTALQHIHGESSRQPSLPREARTRRYKSRRESRKTTHRHLSHLVEGAGHIKYQSPKPEKSTHCNLKYLVEELDYIRYQRVDCGHKWTVVQSKFRAKFPMTVFPKPRKTQGLQGVTYRQNKFLPRISDGHLKFMENGHVEAVCVKTRGQTRNKQLYTLVYLYPDRAMNYTWVSLSERQRACELNKRREMEMQAGRLRAIEKGTYIEKLPTDVPCGCCPGEDRERDPEKRAENKLRKMITC